MEAASFAAVKIFPLNIMGAVNKSGIELNRKVLADLAMNHPDAFKAVVDSIKK